MTQPDWRNPGVGATLAAGCGKKDDSVAQAEKKDVAKGDKYLLAGQKSINDWKVGSEGTWKPPAIVASK